MLSIPHMIVVFIVVLVVFGPQKLPELARGLGKLMAEFRKASTDFRSAFEEEMREMERQALQAERKKAAEAAATSAVAAEGSPTSAPAGSGATDMPSVEASVETSGGEGPVVSPVAESVPRLSEDPAKTSTETVTSPNSEEPLHDQHPSA